MPSEIPHDYDNAPRPVVDLADLERQKAEFLKRGKIKVIPDGVTAATAQTAGRTHSRKQKIKIEKGEF